MIITKKAIPRRAVLRGVGATLALPFLDSMVPPLTALGQTAARPSNRLGVVYVPNGMVMKGWTPAAEGTAFEFTPTLAPLEPFRDRLIIVSGLNSKPWPGEKSTAHAKASTKFLTNMPPKSTTGSDLYAGTSMDQLVARQFASETQLASLELSLESTESAATCEVGFSCAYSSTIAWRTPTTPLPMENNPRVVFERLFGDGGSTDPAVRRGRIEQQRSILDSLRESVDRFQRKLGTGDRSKVSEYLEAVREVERRIQNIETEGARELPVLDRPVGIPATFGDHIKLMFDLQVLAYQTDLSRVITFMVGREFSGRQYPEIGVPDAHHPISHHAGDLAKIASLAKINAYHVRLFSYYLEKLAATADGDGSLLDHMTIIYGAGISEPNAHDPFNLPVLLVGGGAGLFKGGRHVRYPAGTPLANLNLTLLKSFGVHLDKFGDSTGPLDSIL